MDQNKRSLTIEWDLTYQCNLNCLHCSATRARDMKGSLALRDFEEVVRKLSPYHCTLHINPSAGESTTKRDFVEIYNLIAHNLNTLRMTTNGTLLGKIVDEMYLGNLSMITISMDGPKEINDMIRGSNTYEMACNSLKALCEKKESENLGFDIQVNCVINRLNSESLEDMISILDEYDVAVMNIIRIDLNAGNAKTHADALYLPHEECIRSIGRILQELKMANKTRKKMGKKPILLRPELLTAKWLYLLAKTYGLEYLIFEKRHVCHVLTRKYIYLDPLGNAFPCLFFTNEKLQENIVNRYGKVAAPSILEDNVEGILASCFFENGRILLKELLNFDNLPCKYCSFLNTCAVCPVYAQLWGVENDCF